MTVGRIIDISSAQHNGLPPGVGPRIDWRSVKDNGVTTAIVKATQGTNYVNPWFDLDVQGALGNGIDVLAYHFADFGDPTAEAEFFLSEAGKIAAVGDFETSTNVAWMRTFLQALGRPADRCVGYGSLSTFGGVYQQIPALPWVAAYQRYSPGWGVMWQFTDNAQIPGIPTAVDESKWQGSQIQYDTLFGVYDPPEPPEEDDMKDYYLTNKAGTGFVVAADLSSKTGIVDAADAQALIATGQYVLNLELTDAQINAIPNV